MWQPQPQTNRPKIIVPKMASAKKMKPALIAPLCKVCMDSEGSIGETVRPAIHHWMTWATMSRFTRPSAAARQRLVFDFRMPLRAPEKNFRGSPAVTLPVRFSMFSHPVFTKNR